MNIQVALDALSDLETFFVGSRTDEKFEIVVNNAKKTAEKLEIETEFETC